MGCVTRIHYESLGSYTVYAAVRVSVMRAQASQPIALFLAAFIICHFSIIKESTKLRYTSRQGHAAVTLEAAVSAVGSNPRSPPRRGKNQSLQATRAADDTAPCQYPPNTNSPFSQFRCWQILPR